MWRVVLIRHYELVLIGDVGQHVYNVNVYLVPPR